jgi:hypothetical protein
VLQSLFVLAGHLNDEESDQPVADTLDAKATMVASVVFMVRMMGKSESV